MNQLNRSVFTQELLRKLGKLLGLREMYRPPNPNPLVLPYHKKWATV